MFVTAFFIVLILSYMGVAMNKKYITWGVIAFVLGLALHFVGSYYVNTAIYYLGWLLMFLGFILMLVGLLTK